MLIDNKTEISQWRLISVFLFFTYERMFDMILVKEHMCYIKRKIMKITQETKIAFETAKEPILSLSHAKIIDIMKDYYNTDKSVKSIIKKYDIPIQSSKLVKTFPKIITQETCPYDGEHMLLKPHSRNGIDEDDLFCHICGHVENSSYCNCVNCRKIREQKEEEKICRKQSREKEIRQEIITNFDLTKIKKILLNKLNLKDSIYLAALIESMASENLMMITPYKSSSLSLTPTIKKENVLLDKFSYQVIKYLYDRKLIVIDPYNSSVSAFSKEDDYKTFFVK